MVISYKLQQEETRKINVSIFGKDEVGGSNPPSSSRKHLRFSDLGCFFVDLYFP